MPRLCFVGHESRPHKNRNKDPQKLFESYSKEREALSANIVREVTRLRDLNIRLIPRVVRILNP